MSSKRRAEARVWAVVSRPEAVAGNPRGGHTILEFSLVFMLFLVLVLGLMEFGRALWTQHTIAHAARQAGRYAIVRGSTHDNPATADQIKQVLANQAIGLNSTKLSASTTVTWTPDNNPGDVVQIQVQYDFVPISGSLVISSIPLRSTTQMIILN